MFFDAFDSIRILNLPHRADRRREMRHELKRLGIADDQRVSFFEASRAEGMGGFSSKNVHGCFASHLRLLEEAAKARERVLVLEDDCDFAPAARIYELPPEWDIFYGGYLADTPDDLDNSNMIGAHCMGYSPRAVKRLAAYLRDLLEDPNFTPDPIAAADSDFDPRIKPPFDGAIVWFRRANVDLKTIFAQIAVQRSSRSDIADGSFLDRTLPSAAAVARKVKNRLRRWR